ncbi:lanthionine synthetase C family protein [Streptomyces rishiriensis]|uniref:lanthionine synthetase C family protein n=1 Tax=Streptomyces rishiriensis TaxID=68264 RepID=UPI0037D2910F
MPPEPFPRSTLQETSPSQNAARDLADWLAERLSSPDQVDRSTGLGGGSDSVHLKWSPASLARGYPGIALLFINRAHRDRNSMAIAHQYLARSVDALQRKRPADFGLLDDLCGLAFALEMAHRLTGGYKNALKTLDREISSRAKAMRDWIRTEQTGEVWRYDAISGLAGVGRYMLLRQDQFAGDLQGVLDCLVWMSEDLESPRPRFWSPSPPAYSTSDPALLTGGHLNLGMAHGIAGPLSLLALAFAAGHEVPGQRDAAERIVGVYSAMVLRDKYGQFWPRYLSHEQWASGIAEDTRSHASWCYGIPGTARSLQIAASSFEREDWNNIARGPIAGLIASPVSSWQLVESGLCHGWAGALHLIGLTAQGDSMSDAGLLQEEIAQMIFDTFQEQLPFGFRAEVTNHHEGADYPGLLEGAAGIAMALESYANPAHSEVPWDAALLVR